MRPEQFWQNFSLGQELEISCNFIYDALRNLYDIRTLSLETEVFPILYNLSIGLERILKIVVILTELDDNTVIEDLENSLRNHDHPGLLSRIRNNHQVNLGSSHTEFLSLLAKFYKTYRYGRFSIQSVHTISDDKKSLQEFLSKYLDIKLNRRTYELYNEPRIKKFVGKLTKKIISELLEIIKLKAAEKNIYTYEISRSDSKAGKILYGNEFIDFEHEEIAALEIIRFLLSNPTSKRLELLQDIEPLSFDDAQIPQYLNLLLSKNSANSSLAIDEIEALYEDIENLKERLEIIKVVKDTSW